MLLTAPRVKCKNVCDNSRGAFSPCLTHPVREFLRFSLVRRVESHWDILFPRQAKVLSYRNTETLTVEVQCFSLRKVAVMASQQREIEEPFAVDAWRTRGTQCQTRDRLHNRLPSRTQNKPAHIAGAHSSTNAGARRRILVCAMRTLSSCHRVC
jgi:hypothetical protein